MIALFFQIELDRLNKGYQSASMLHAGYQEKIGGWQTPIEGETAATDR